MFAERWELSYSQFFNELHCSVGVCLSPVALLKHICISGFLKTALSRTAVGFASSNFGLLVVRQ